MKSKTFYKKQKVTDQVNDKSELIKTKCVKDNKINKSLRSISKNKKNKNKETLDKSNIEVFGTHTQRFKPTSMSQNNILTSTSDNMGDHSNKSSKSIKTTKSNSPITLQSVSNVLTPKSEHKKRNKSESFMLKDAEGVLAKKVKSSESSNKKKNLNKERKSKNKLINKKSHSEIRNMHTKENQTLNGDVIKLQYKNKPAIETSEQEKVKDSEGALAKKVKSSKSNHEQQNLTEERKHEEKPLNKLSRRQKKKLQARENQNLNEDILQLHDNKKPAMEKMEQEKVEVPVTNVTTSENPSSEVQKKVKKAKKIKPQQEEGSERSENNPTDNQISENKAKKLKNKRKKSKILSDANVEVDGEPAVKIRKKAEKPVSIAKQIQNLNIGDNANTLSKLLNRMSVVDKNRKRDRKKLESKRFRKTVNAELKPEQESDQVGTVEKKEKVKWCKRKWNKDTKGHSKRRLLTGLVVENLPLKIMCNYKSLLSEHFGKFGTVTGIGIIETYAAVDARPVFTTTIYFQDEDAATEALEADNTSFEGNRIRVRRPLPASETTILVRMNVAHVTDQFVSSVFCNAGRIRNIRHTTRGRKAKGTTTFVEFDGPEAVEQALKIATDAKICGKKISVYKYNEQEKNETPPAETDPPTDRQV